MDSPPTKFVTTDGLVGLDSDACDDLVGVALAEEDEESEFLAGSVIPSVHVEK